MRQLAAVPRTRTNRRFVAFILLAAVALLAAGPYLGPVGAVVSPVYVPVATAVSTVISDATGSISSLTNLPGLERQNRRLRHENAQLVQRLAMLPLYRRENNALTREAHFRDLNPTLHLLSATRIGGSLSGLGATIVVGAGSNQGVRLNNPVLDSNGYVLGKVTQVWPAQSTVSLLSDPNVSVPAMDSRTAAQGIIDSPNNLPPRLDLVLTGKRLAKGDLVVTSGLGREFPVGRTIGQISRVFRSNVNAMQYASIRTAANLDNAQYVQIVLNFPPSRPSIGFGEKLRAEASPK